MNTKPKMRLHMHTIYTDDKTRKITSILYYLERLPRHILVKMWEYRFPKDNQPDSPWTGVRKHDREIGIHAGNPTGWI